MRIKEIIANIEKSIPDAKEFGKRALESGANYDNCTEDKEFMAFVESVCVGTQLQKMLECQLLFSAWWTGYRSE